MENGKWKMENDQTNDKRPMTNKLL